MAAVGDIFEVTAEFTVALQRMLNIYHVVTLNAADDEEIINDIATQLDDAYDAVDGIMSGSTNFTSLLFKNLTSDTDLGSMDWPTMTVGGIAAGTLLPTQNAYLVAFPTMVARRIGKKFIPGVDETRIVSGVADATALAALAAFGVLASSAFVGGVSGATLQFVVKAATSLAFSSIQDVLVTNVISTLHRRRIGVGE